MKLKTPKLIGAIVLIASLIFISCHKDDDVKQNAEQRTNYNFSTAQAKYINASEGSQIIQHLSTRLGVTTTRSSSDELQAVTSFGTIGLSSILEVIDEEGIINYTFSLIPNTSEKNSVWNLVVPNVGEEPYILEYKMTNDFASKYLRGEALLIDFKGTVVRYKIVESSGETKNFEPVISPCAEFEFVEEEVSPGGSTGSSGGGGSGDGADFEGGSSSNDFNTGSGSEDVGGVSTGGSPCTWEVAYVSCGGRNGNIPHSQEECGVEGGSGSYYVLTINCPPDESDYRTVMNDSDDPCEDDDKGTVGISLVPYDIILQRLMRELELSTWHLSEERTYQVFNFLEDYGWDTELLGLVRTSVMDSYSYTVDDFPGKESGLPFEWWLDEEFIINSGNFDLAPDEKPNAKEVALFMIFSNQAVLHIENSLVAFNRAIELVTDGVLTGIEDGRADAFRHAYWNALGSAEFGSSIMKLFADAHEWGQSGLASEMDFFNNHIGRSIGDSEFTFLSSDEEISARILESVFNGDLRYINAGSLTPTNL